MIYIYILNFDNSLYLSESKNFNTILNNSNNYYIYVYRVLLLPFSIKIKKNCII